MFKTVLFPIDQSPESRQAAETVAGLVKLCNSRLVVLSIVELPGAATQPDAGDVMSSPEAIAQLLEQAKQLFSKQGITNVETLERESNKPPAFAICDIAEEVGAEVIVMGCRGLGLTDEGTADSVTNKVINLSPCPVLIVP